MGGNEGVLFWLFSLAGFSHLFPDRTPLVRVESNELLLPGVKSRDVAARSFGINKRQAHGDHLVRYARRWWQVASADRFVGWQGDGSAAPQEGRGFDDLAENGDVVTFGDVFASDSAGNGDRVHGVIGGGRMVLARVLKLSLCGRRWFVVTRRVSFDVALASFSRVLGNPTR